MIEVVVASVFDVVTVAFPSSPDSVEVFIAALLLTVKDDSTVRSTRVTHDKISFGSRDIAKFSVTCVGR